MQEPNHQQVALQNQMSNLTVQQSNHNQPQKKIYEVATSLGRLTFEITKFSQYIIIVVCYSGLLKLDGYLQVAYPTHFSQNPTVLHLAKDQGIIDCEKLIQRLSKQTKCPIFLSLNLEEVKQGAQEQLFQVLKSILIPKKE